MKVQLAIASMAVGLCATSSLAAFENEVLADWHGEAGTSYTYFESFQSASGGANAAFGPYGYVEDNANGGHSVALFNFGNGAVVASSGNLYGAGGALNIHTYAYTDTDATGVHVNVSTAGTTYDPSSIGLAYTTTDGGQGFISGFLAEFSSNFDETSSGPWGDITSQNFSYTFDLSGIAGTVDSLGFFMDSLGSNMSLDALSIDIQSAVIPAPAALALLGLAGVAGRRRRRN